MDRVEMNAKNESDAYNDIMHAAKKAVFRGVSSALPDEVTEPPSEVFHYTTAEALTKIVGEDSLFATHINYLNDASEMRGALEFAALVLSKNKEANGLGFVSHLRSYVGETMKMNPYAFVSCFCSNGDLLSQWRGYGEAVEGYAIGFESATLEAAVGENGYLKRCIYEEKHKREFFEAWAHAGSVFYASARNEYASQLKPMEIKDAAVTGAYNAIAHLMPLLKSPAFSEEEECRLVVLASGEAISTPKSIVRKGLLVPYVSIKLPERSASSVVIGPSLRQEQRFDGLEYFRRHVLDDYPLHVRKSKITYRGP